MKNVAVVGLGYVGLPLAVAFGRLCPTIGYDLSESKLDCYRNQLDPSGTVSSSEIRSATQLVFTSRASDLASADYIIVAVPTPVDDAHNPDFGPLLDASRCIGAYMKPGCTVIFESTVFPGATEDICIPALEKASGKRWKNDFHVGYSPERINPGDRKHTLANTIKVVAGDGPATLARVRALYEEIVPAGIHSVSSIKVAEAAKVIENTQRDLNIALMNELAIIFGMIGLDSLDVLEAAGTKWNFLPFRPGLVGGHCIGVDPYYLTYVAERLGYHPQVILAGRRINDGMGKYVAEQTIKQMIRTGSPMKGAQVNVLGITFKENVPDVRNSRVVDLVRELQSYGVTVHLHDPVASQSEVLHDYGLKLTPWDSLPQADAVVVAVAHHAYTPQGNLPVASKVLAGGCVMDVKGTQDVESLREVGLHVWRL